MKTKVAHYRKNVTTSAIIGKRNGCVLTDSGSLYELGEPAAEYEKQFPGAKGRVLANLPEV